MAREVLGVDMNSGDLVDVTRLANSIGIRRKCLMRRDVLWGASEQVEAMMQEQAVARAMGVLFWLRRAWSVDEGQPPPKVFQAKTGVHDGQRFEVEEVDDSILVGMSS
jgi:hypothetical protein